jgi:hypothetical protein
MRASESACHSSVPFLAHPLSSRRYTYSLCFFGEATQKSNNNGARTSLGHFKGWSSEAPQGSDDYYMKQLYAEGQRCWNGPARSAKVRHSLWI